MQNEHGIMKHLIENGGHRNLVTPKAFYSKSNRHYLIMEIFKGKELFKDIKKNGVYTGIYLSI
jgi:serine/threonine protein kinase